MAKSTRKIEQAAVNYISDLISECPHLNPYIDSNDKTPFTDGFIDIHNICDSEKIGTISGRVNVQIKGTTNKLKDKKFRIKRDYLAAHLMNSGVLFLVVTMDKNLQNRKAYYRSLGPFAIQNILQRKSEKQKTVAIELSDFPTELEDIEEVVKFSFNAKKENPAVSEMIEHISIDEFLLRTPEGVDLSRPQILSREQKDYSLEVKLSNGTFIPFDVELEITPPDYCYKEIEHSVSSGEVTFDKIYRRKISDDIVELKLSEGLSFLIEDPRKNSPFKLNLRLQNSLGACLKDLQFYSSFINGDSFRINGKVQKYSPDSLDKGDNIVVYLNYLEQLAALLSCLGVQDLDLIDLDAITEQQHDGLGKLYLSVVKEKKTSSSCKRSMQYHQSIGDWVIATVLVPDKSDGNRGRFFSFFAPEAACRSIVVPRDESESIACFVVTPFDVIDPEVFPYVINLPLKRISDYYEEVKEYPDAFELVNMMVLRLINGADLVPLRKEEFLTAAFELNEWLILQSGEQPHHLVNRWQIVKRQSGFNEETKNHIREFILDSSISTTIRLACWILLENKDEVEFLFGRLDEACRRNLREWPIWKLYEDLL